MRHQSAKKYYILRLNLFVENGIGSMLYLLLDNFQQFNLGITLFQLFQPFLAEALYISSPNIPCHQFVITRNRIVTCLQHAPKSSSCHRSQQTNLYSHFQSISKRCNCVRFRSNTGPNRNFKDITDLNQPIKCPNTWFIRKYFCFSHSLYFQFAIYNFNWTFPNKNVYSLQ